MKTLELKVVVVQKRATETERLTMQYVLVVQFEHDGCKEFEVSQEVYEEFNLGDVIDVELRKHINTAEACERFGKALAEASDVHPAT